MKIISVCNQKGGVGKTTTAINLSSYLSTKGYAVLLIDMDPQTNASSGIGIESDPVRKNIYHVLLEQASLDEVILTTKISNLCIVPASMQLAGAQIELTSALGREFKLRQAITQLKNRFDFIFIDCPPSLGILTINALAASDSTFIPLQCEYYAMEGLSQLLKTIDLVKKNLNAKLIIEGVLLTMADYRTRLTSEVINEAKNVLKDSVYSTIIPRSVKLSESPGYGEPIMLYDKTSHGAISYEQAAEEFINRNSIISNELQHEVVAQEEQEIETKVEQGDLTEAQKCELEITKKQDTMQ